MVPGLFGIGSLAEIPAGERNHVIERSTTLPVDVKVYFANPHAHYLAKEFKATATLPDGSTKPLLWIQDWDFNWQDGYNYKQPVILPKGHAHRRPYHLRQLGEPIRGTRATRRSASGGASSRRMKWAPSASG